MPTSIPSIRPGFRTASPYLMFRDGRRALEFYEQALGAERISADFTAEGRLRHGEFRLGDSTFMIATENPDYPQFRSVEAIGDSPVGIFLYVDDVDARLQRALATGATEVMPVTDQGYGRSGGIRDPFGLVWWFSTHREKTPSGQRGAEC